LSARLRRAAGSSLPRVLPFDSRRRIAAALERCTRNERQLLALMLCERLSAPEAADVLGLSAREVQRAYAGLLRELDVALSGDSARAGRRPRLAAAEAGWRKAS
jgi:DNA-directed RNA polymerase specialized sigma24 family protein